MRINKSGPGYIFDECMKGYMIYQGQSNRMEKGKKKQCLAQADLVPVRNMSVLYLQGLKTDGSKIYQKCREKCILYNSKI